MSNKIPPLLACPALSFYCFTIKPVMYKYYLQLTRVIHLKTAKVRIPHLIILSRMYIVASKTSRTEANTTTLWHVGCMLMHAETFLPATCIRIVQL
jgi:hypothetical protein